MKTIKRIYELLIGRDLDVYSKRIAREAINEVRKEIAE